MKLFNSIFWHKSPREESEFSSEIYVMDTHSFQEPISKLRLIVGFSTLFALVLSGVGYAYYHQTSGQGKSGNATKFNLSTLNGTHASSTSSPTSVSASTRTNNSTNSPPKNSAGSSSSTSGSTTKSTTSSSSPTTSSSSTSSSNPPSGGSGGSGIDLATNPSGQAMPGPISGYTEVCAENFTKAAALGSWGTSSASKIVYSDGCNWTEYPDGWPSTFTGGAPGYEPSQVLSVHDGELDFYLHPINGQAMGANPSPVLASGSQYQTYGKYIV
ncbi:MAG: hypothetical protein ACREF7_02825, partial [Candidatus Saccharimonadales bacterium]